MSKERNSFQHNLVYNGPTARSTENLSRLQYSRQATTINAETNMLYPSKLLNNLPFPGIPNHVLKLTVGMPVMPLPNMNQSFGLYNGTSMTIIQLGRRFIEAQ